MTDGFSIAISATGIDRAQVSAEFTEHAEQEREHAMRVAERISQLGGAPDFDPGTIAQRAHTTYATYADDDLEGMLKENLVAERIVIESYQEIIRWLGDGDVTTRRLMEDILEEEEEHADDILDLLGQRPGAGRCHSPEISRRPAARSTQGNRDGSSRRRLTSGSAAHVAVSDR